MNSNSKLTLIDLTITNGKSNDNGGLIYNEGGEITIKNCILRNSKAVVNGGVIYNFGTLNIEDTSFINNSATQYGGVLYTSGETNIRNSNFTQNFLTSIEAVGGCIASDGIINLEGCLFSKNYVPYSAAALLNLGNATINNCRFEYLTTNYTAGAISNHNYAVINNSYFGYNDVQYYAAAFLAPPSGHHVITKVYNTIIEQNHAGFLGAVTNNFKDTELIMENCAIVGNYIVKGKHYGDISLDDNATVLYCWWGQNSISPYYYSPHDGNHRPEKINASRWLIMTFTSDSLVYKNKNNVLTVDLNYYFDNETKEIYKLNESINLPLEVTVYTDSQTITQKLVNGVATFNIKPGAGDEVVYAKIDNQILNLNVHSNYTTLIVNDFTKYYKTSKKLSVKLIDGNNKCIAGEKVSIVMGGKTHTSTTNKNGIATFNIKDTPKTFNVKVSYKGNENYTAATKTIKVKVVKPTIKASKTTIRKKGKFVVTFKDANKKVIKNVRVKFKINGKTYYKTTNNKGQAKLTINLKANKKYTVKVGFKSTKTYGTTTLTKKIKVIK
jgi:predicted outer membrane repeat protein